MLLIMLLVVFGRFPEGWWPMEERKGGEIRSSGACCRLMAMPSTKLCSFLRLTRPSLSLDEGCFFHPFAILRVTLCYRRWTNPALSPPFSALLFRIGSHSQTRRARWSKANQFFPFHHFLRLYLLILYFPLLLLVCKDRNWNRLIRVFFALSFSFSTILALIFFGTLYFL